MAAVRTLQAFFNVFDFQSWPPSTANVGWPWTASVRTLLIS